MLQIERVYADFLFDFSVKISRISLICVLIGLANVFMKMPCIIQLFTTILTNYKKRFAHV
jgi:hypothetical protein